MALIDKPSLTLFALALFLSTWWITLKLIHLAHQKALLNEVNERSSHQIPTPRIGGLGFIMVMALAIFSTPFWNQEGLAPRFMPQEVIGLFVPPLIVAALGLLDDLYGLGRRIRFLGYLAASAICVIPLFLLSTPVTPLMVLAALLLLFSICWHINLFNFMDGIDGIAGSQALFVLASLYWLSPHLGLIPLLLCMPILGFLMLNWQPASIFMGDAGSTFLGSLLCGLLLVAIKKSDINWVAALILTASFWVDATWTLLYRFLTHQEWYNPHRSHSYQILSRTLGSHQKVTTLFLMINVIWLLPLSYLSIAAEQYKFLILAVSVLPLLTGCFIIGAGNPKR